MSTLATKEIKELIEEVIDRQRLMTAITENLEGSQLCEEIDVLFEAYREQVRSRIDDKEDWIGWFMYENDFGARGFNAKPSDKHELKEIRTVDDLVWLIEESR